MGDFNPNIPTLVGLEDFFTKVRTIDLASPLSGVAERINPGAVTPTAFAVFSKTSKNSVQGIELQDVPVPLLIQETIFPGTNTGAFATNWQSELVVAGADFTRVNKNTDDSTHMDYNGLSAVGKQSSPNIGYHSGWNRGGMNDLAFRGNRSALYGTSGLRVVSVTMNARVSCASSKLQFSFGLMVPGGTQLDTFVSPVFRPGNAGTFRTYSYTLPGDPWAMAIGTTTPTLPYYGMPHFSKTWDDVVTTAGPLVFGIIPVDTSGNGGGNTIFQVSGLWLTVTYATENRRFCGYPRTPLPVGWNKLGGGVHFAGGPRQRPVIFTSNAATTALTTPAPGTAGAGMFTSNDAGATIVRASDGQVVGTVSSVTNGTTAVLTANGASTNASVLGYLGVAPSALTAATYYYLVQDTVQYNPQTQVQQDLIKDPIKVVTTAPGTGENRETQSLVMSGAGSYVATQAVPVPGELQPALLYVGAVVQPESQPYAALLPAGLSEIRSGQGVAQQATGTAATLYAGVRVVVSRWSTTQDPDQPLTVEIRHGAGALTGGGTLDASGTIPVSALDGTNGLNKATAVSVKFGTSFTSILNQQYVVYFRSGATAGRGWGIVLLDSRSDVVTNATVADVEGATVGGQTDGYANPAGTVLTRYDTPAALISPPTAPAGLAASVVNAT